MYWCYLNFSPILRNGLRTVLKRTWNGPKAKAERRQSEGIAKDEIRFLYWCNTLGMKKEKSFLRGYYTFCGYVQYFC